MTIVIDANWDDEANLWVAVAREEIGLATESESLDRLRERVALMLADLFEDPHAGVPDFDIVVHSRMRGSAPMAAE